jgi:hypothetical protein
MNWSWKCDGMLSEKARRHLLGLLALAFLGLAAGLLITVEDGTLSFRSGTLFAVGSMSWRIGLTLAVLWLALPQVLVLTRRLPPRLTATLLVGGLIAIASRGKALLPVLLVILLMIGVEIAAGVLKPFSRHRGKR